MRRALLAVLSAASITAFAQAPPPQWPDTYLARVQALALMQTLNADILGSRSATRSLEAWCRDHRLASEPRIVAHRLPAAAKTATPEQRERLDVKDGSDVRYRRVRLACGSNVLSEAETWYVPARLAPEMNRLLEASDTPFGRAVEALQPYRVTFAVTLLWSPLPEGWERGATSTSGAPGGTLMIPDALFEHRALLYTREHRPFAEVVEVYQRQILAFPPPAPR